MANPFLMDEELSDGGNEAYSNPFLMQDTAEDDNEFGGSDNPFATGSSSNPFAAFGADDESDGIELGGDYTTTMTTDMDFFGTTTEPITTTSNVDYFLENVIENDPISNDDSNGSSHFFDTTIMDDEPPGHHAKPVDLQLKNPINDVPFFMEDTVESSEEEIKMIQIKKGPPPRPGPPPTAPSKATQDLIMSVANELDFTSTHLLDRIPKTRTPSPVSMRDFHSPSPTPGELADLMDATDDPQNNFFINQESSDPNPFGGGIQNIIQPIYQPTVIPQQQQQQPPRPPPPRPAPPSRPSPVSHFPPPIPPQPIHHPHPQRPLPPHQKPTPPQPVHQEPDLFDMFGSEEAPMIPPKPPAPKSKEDILSLYSVGTTNSTTTNANQHNEPINKMPDLLMDDLMESPIPSMNEIPDFTQKQAISIKPPTPPSSLNLIHTNMEMENKAVVEEIIEPMELRLDINLANPPDLIPSAISPGVAGIFNMVISCEPDNPPSDEEEDNMNYHPTPSNQQMVSEHTDADELVVVIEEPVESESSELAESIDVPEIYEFDVDPGVSSVNPFASPPDEIEMSEPSFQADPIYQPPPTPATGFDNDVPMDIFGGSAVQQPVIVNDEFDAFAAKFDSANVVPSKSSTNIFLEDLTTDIGDGFGGAITSTDAWGDSGFNDAVVTNASGGDDGFGADEGFDSFLAMSAPPPPPIRASKIQRSDSRESEDGGKEFNVVIRPKEDLSVGGITPILAPPPPKGSQNNSIYSGDSSPRFNPFDKGFEDASSVEGAEKKVPIERSESQESAQTPLFDDDVSQPLEDFPRITYTGDGWEIQLRQPNKKRITAQRFWKKIHLRLALQGDNPVLQLLNGPTDKDPFQELPLQACYSVSEISAQQYDQFGKIFTVKLQYIFYKERPGVRPGQVTKAERLTSKLSQFAAYAIQGDYQGVKEFGSDLKKLGIPVEHAPQVSELFKMGSLSFEDMKQFSVCIEEALFKLDVHRDRALNYKTEEVQITAVDELYVEQDSEGHVIKQIARVRLFFLGFLSGMPFVELGVNDLWRQGKEVVGRHDIIPVVTEEWIRLEGVEFHTCVHQDEYERTRTIKFQPPDACYIELMRFRVRPPKNRELPLMLKATWCVNGNKVELRADILVPGFASRKLGQIPCEDVMIRFPIPECWIYLFRVEKHFRYGSVKSAHRRTGKVKGIERILGAVDQLQESLIEVTSGNAKYEHQHRALVWRCPRLPKEGQGAYTTHQLVCRMALTSYDQIPEQLAPFCFVEFTMPATQVSHTTVRSVSIQESDSDDPPEKYVRYLARHEYTVGIEHTTNDTTNPYLAATQVKTIREEPAPPPKVVTPLPTVPSDSDSDSN